ncbi:MAG: hypothetical protein WCG49_01700 [Actinomycetes bacterium]|jgi:hypothetical protein
MSIFRLFRKSRHREWRKPGFETHEILLSANDPHAEEFAAALRSVNVDVCVLSNINKWLEETVAIRAIAYDGKKYQARIAIVRGAPSGELALQVAGVLSIAFASNFTQRQLKLALKHAMPASPK